MTTHLLYYNKPQRKSPTDQKKNHQRELRNTQKKAERRRSTSGGMSVIAVAEVQWGW